MRHECGTLPLAIRAIETEAWTKTQVVLFNASQKTGDAYVDGVKMSAQEAAAPSDSPPKNIGARGGSRTQDPC